jgi:hypothetical protein
MNAYPPDPEGRSVSQIETPARGERERGLQRTNDPRVFGVVVGMAGATVFVLVNRVQLPEPWPMVALMAWLLTLGACVGAALVRRRGFAPLPRPRPRAAGVYGASVVGMALLVVCGAQVLTRLGDGGLVPALVALAVGLHFVPFARAFHAPVFTGLGWGMAGLGGLGLLLGAAWTPVAAPAAAVLAGLTMLVLMTVDALAQPAPITSTDE